MNPAGVEPARERVEDPLPLAPHLPAPELLAFLECFNAAEYYRAHDELEHLWLRVKGPERDFYKGLIQLAGAFVHLRKHAEGERFAGRLGPAARLFFRSAGYLAAYPPGFCGIDVERVLGMCQSHIDFIEKGEFRSNPWREERRPTLRIEGKFFTRPIFDCLGLRCPPH